MNSISLPNILNFESMEEITNPWLKEDNRLKNLSLNIEKKIEAREK